MKRAAQTLLTLLGWPLGSLISCGNYLVLLGKSHKGSGELVPK